ncbi:hypothetical protein Dsin_018141 [Dipteronia sinensis]|uniref:DNA-directed RNA polymerase III subunit RPC4 n=1 Tax=Dipteronia sinensis TaxID=43782 RepID=A0AAE0AGG2_9ROSI|nr:hypothetical protein Dsin_018141 [Dipteronia sinensis]
MEPDTSNNNNNNKPAARKYKFKPKIPPVQPKTEVKNEVVENADSAKARDLMRRFKENQGALKPRPKVEKKVAASQIAFGYGGASASIKSYGVHKGSSSNRARGSALNGGAYASGLRGEKEYKEPWDYYSYYPVTLPLRRPYSGNPELLDEEEFGEDSETVNYEEISTNPAVELGLMEENPEPSMVFLQLPPSMPMIKRSVKAEDGQEAIAKAKPRGGARTIELPAGFMGKMLVYRSGVVKLKLGETLYDVTAGLNCTFAQDVAAINTADKNCCIVGELNKRAILTPDVDSVLRSLADL